MLSPVAAIELYQRVRLRTEALCKHLSPEDQVPQSMPDASPVRWHRAHMTWFFETFVLKPNCPKYSEFDSDFARIFNSYYVSVGERSVRAERGFMTRPSVAKVTEYRAHVDGALCRYMESNNVSDATLSLIELGLNHEEQHQELILMDVKHLLSRNPLNAVYAKQLTRESGNEPELYWREFSEGIVQIGHTGEGFSFDNEGPRHKAFVAAFALASRPITNREYLAFMEDGGYTRDLLWLSDGFATVQKEGWSAPLYWNREGSEWFTFTLAGYQPVQLSEPVCHLSFYEADAYARWAGCRLPTEQEWEVAAENVPIEGTFMESGWYHPLPSGTSLYGNVWEWTRSSYEPYRGFSPVPDAVGEYNGKFMINQMVLRGGSCVTPRKHVRKTYRNFFYPHQRWQFSGVRLAKDLV